MDLDIGGDIALVTGSSSGLGKAAATWGERVPIGGIGDPMELKNTVAFLCSPAAGYVNGEGIDIDGGSGRSTL